MMLMVKFFHSLQIADITWNIKRARLVPSRFHTLYPQLGFSLKYGLLTKNLSWDHEQQDINPIKVF